MKKLFLPLTLCAVLGLAACGGSPDPGNGGRSANNANAAGGAASQAAPAATPAGLPPVSSAHGGARGPAGANAPAGGGGGGEVKPSVDTSALDSKIAQAEAKGKRAGASEADKKALAAAYVERGNAYRDAGGVNYRFALGDYRRALRYDPNNQTARSRADEIVSIYQSMGRPVPNNGLEQ